MSLYRDYIFEEQDIGQEIRLQTDIVCIER
jgi:hypothetical protein